MQTNRFSIKKRIKSFGYSLAGIRQFVKTQHNAWLEIGVALLVIIAGFVLQVEAIEWCFLLFAIGFVLVCEAFNTAIEFLVDLVSPQQNKLAGAVKDIAAGAVLLSACTAAAIGLIVFIPYIF